MPNLYLIPLPLDTQTGWTHLPPEVGKILPDLTHFLVENVRTSRRFISSLQLGIDISSLHFEVLDKNTQAADLTSLTREMKGQDIGVMSEAGCPGVADPGALVVGWAHKLGYRVIPITGPSSILLALMASGFNGQSFAFQGYLPIKKEERAKKIHFLEKLASSQDQTQIFIETPYRNNGLLKDLISNCHSQTKLCVAVDLTGERELIISKSIANWKHEELDLHKRPCIFLLYAN